MKSATRLILIDVLDKNFSGLDSPLNLIMISNYLVKRGIINKKNIRVISTSSENPIKTIQLFKPNLIGLSVMTPFYPKAVKLAKKIKSMVNTPIIIGGYHISGVPELMDKVFDFGVIGEGEEVLEDIIKNFSKKGKLNFQKIRNIENLVFWKGNNIIVNKRRPILNVNKIPKIDWSVIPKEKIFKHITTIKFGIPQSMKITSIYTARGCPYHCAFCAHQVLWPNGSGLRFFSTKKVGDEIEYLYKKYNIDCFQILDDTFAVSTKRLSALINELKKRKLLGKIFFYNLFIRANLVNNEFAKLLRKFGAMSVFLGIESGSENVLSYLKDGPLKPIDVKRAVKIFDKYKIFVVGSFMLFSPNETKGDLDDSLNLAKWFVNQPNALGLVHSITTPYPGTKLWNYSIRKKIINANKVNWSKFVMLNINKIDTPPEIFFYNNFTNKDVEYYWKAFRNLSSVVTNKINNYELWSNEDKTTQDNNYLSAKSLERKIVIRSLKNKFLFFIKYPLVSLNKLFKKPKIIKYTLKEINKLKK